MKTKDFKKLKETKKAEIILEEYMMGKHSKLTERQLQKIIDLKEPKNQGHGAIYFSFESVKKSTP